MEENKNVYVLTSDEVILIFAAVSFVLMHLDGQTADDMKYRETAKDIIKKLSN